MRAFGFLAIFATFAAALPTPGHLLSGNDLANDNSLHGVANGNSLEIDTRDLSAGLPALPGLPGLPDLSSLPGLPALPHLPALPDIHNVDLTQVSHVSVEVKANILNIVKVDLKVSIDALVTKIRAILDDTTTTVTAKVALLLPLVIKIAIALIDCITKVAVYAVTNVLVLVAAVEDDVTAEITVILTAVIQQVTGILCEVATLVGTISIQLSVAIQLVITLLNTLTLLIFTIIGCLNIPSIVSLIGPIVVALKISGIPGVN